MVSFDHSRNPARIRRLLADCGWPFQRVITALLLISLGAAFGGVLTGVQAGRAHNTVDEHTAEQSIRAVLMAQAEAWNRGDIPAFMQGYLQDENLRFASGDTVQRGWQQTLERYQKHYDTREKMGSLSFQDLEIQVLSSEWAEVFGRYTLKRDPSVGNDTGLFTLLMSRKDDRWHILHDHTSAAENK
ncbi:MAG: YybH family protein [Planctomycetaceae bacterium]